MRIKAILTSILFASTLAGVASAAPIVRDHRGQPQRVAETRPASWSGGVQVTYGYQVSHDGKSVQPYTYGNDPYVEGIARGEWTTVTACAELEGAGDTRIDMGGRSLTAVELQATHGGANITHAGVQYADGRVVAVQINRALDVQHAPNLRIDLGSEGLRGVKAIVLYGSGNTSFRVLAA